ncbi:hypothetical protein SAMN05192588_1164 [Nonlabens sp. Hel1_33_55]|nr:hypothetical protein SAMN05192588_1164 [Nonlabens sp. Hel1_33_55]
MVSFSNNFDDHRIMLVNIEMQVRKKYRRISTQIRDAADKWLDKKTAPYGGFKK